MELTPEVLGSLEWTRSSLSNAVGGACVEVAKLPGGGRAVRDSKDPDGPKLTFTADEWKAFGEGFRAGEFD